MKDIRKMHKIGYSEWPLRREPGHAPSDGDIYLASPEERAHLIQTALDAGVTLFHTTHERDAASLGASLKTLDIRNQVRVSATDGDALDRCPDTVADAEVAVIAAIARKRKLLGVDTIDVFHLYDFRRETHTPARLEGARQALESAQTAGHIRDIGATCYGDYDALANTIEHAVIPFNLVVARYNYYDPRAQTRLFPLCRERGITALAAQTFAWVGGVPFVRFPNTWRLRNLTKNFYGFTAAQAHLHWVLSQPEIDGVIVAMQSAEQIAENVTAAKLLKTPTGLESLFDSFVEAITKTREGWRGLRTDELWEYRAAAEAYLGRKSSLD